VRGVVVELALAGVLAPALAAAVLLLVAWRPWRRDKAALPAWGAPLAVGVAYVAGHVATHGVPHVPRWIGVKEGLVYVAVAATLFGLVEAWTRPAGLVLTLARAAASFALPWALLGFVRAYAWSGREALFWTAGLALALCALWTLAAAEAERLPGARVPLAFLVTCVATSVALGLGRSASLAQLAGVLAVPAGALLVLAWMRPDVSLAPGGLSVLVPVLYGLLLAGVFAAELPLASAAFLAASPLAPALTARGPLARLHPTPRALVAALLVALVAVAALAPLTVAAAEPDPYAGY
jgi:hypothetical protein